MYTRLPIQHLGVGMNLLRSWVVNPVLYQSRATQKLSLNKNRII